MVSLLVLWWDQENFGYSMTVLKMWHYMYLVSLEIFSFTYLQRENESVKFLMCAYL